MMARREERIIDLLADQADRLNGLPGGGSEPTPAERASVGPLMELAGQVKRAMEAVEPSPSFVRSLGRELVAESRRQQAMARRLRRGMVLGAAALGSAISVAGVVTLIVRRKRTQVQPQAISG
jgi:hypothetical protein